MQTINLPCRRIVLIVVALLFSVTLALILNWFYIQSTRLPVDSPEMYPGSPPALHTLPFRYGSDIPWNTDGSKIAVRDGQGSLHILNMPNASLDRTFRVDRRSVQSTAWSPDGNQLAGLLWDRRSGEMMLSIWDVYTGEHRDVVQVDEQAFRLMWSADGSRLANFDLRVVGLTQVWNTTDFSLITQFRLPFYRSAQTSPDLRKVAAVGEAERLQVWDITDTETIVEQQPQWLESLISWSPDMSRLAVVAKAYNLSSVTRVWDVNEARYTHTFDGCNSQTAITWHPKGTALAISCWNLYSGPSAIEIWGLESGLHATLLPPSQAAMISQAFWSPDGLLIAAFGGSTPPGRDNIVQNMVWIWDAKNGSVLQTLHHPPTSVSVTWSPDGGMLATSTPWWMRIWRTSDLVPVTFPIEGQ